MFSLVMDTIKIKKLFPYLAVLDITFSYFFEIFKLFVAERRASEIRVKRISADIILQVIMLCASDVDRHILDIVSGMQSLSDRGPVFIVYLALQ
jgi:hypothetical protein